MVEINDPSMPTSLFKGLSALTTIIVDENNPELKSVDGVLYSKDMKEIILHPMRNHQYRTALAAGMTAPVDEATAKAFLDEFNKKYGDETTVDTEDEEVIVVLKAYETNTIC